MKSEGSKLEVRRCWGLGDLIELVAGGGMSSVPWITNMISSGPCDLLAVGSAFCRGATFALGAVTDRLRGLGLGRGLCGVFRLCREPVGGNRPYFAELVEDLEPVELVESIRECSGLGGLDVSGGFEESGDSVGPLGLFSFSVVAGLTSRS